MPSNGSFGFVVVTRLTREKALGPILEPDDEADAATSWRSYPAQNASPPAPVKTHTFCVSSLSNFWNASASSRAVSALTALRDLGRLIVITAMPSADGS